EGYFRSDLSALYGAEVRDTPLGPRMGAQLLTVLERDGAPPVLVDRGWIPEDRFSEPGRSDRNRVTLPSPGPLSQGSQGEGAQNQPRRIPAHVEGFIRPA